VQQRGVQDDEPSVDNQVQGDSTTADSHVHADRVNNQLVSSSQPSVVVAWPETAIQKDKHVDYLLVLVR